MNCGTGDIKWEQLGRRCAAETFVCTSTGTGAHVSARAGASTGRCTGTGTGT